MSKTRQPQEQQAQQDAQSSERSGPTLSSNDTEQASLGLEGQGADASEFGLGGSFAATILECMPTMPALMMAKRFAHNPAVMAWADGISLAEVADELVDDETGIAIDLPEDAILYSVHAANGERIALVGDRALAFAAARQHEMSPVSVH